MSFPPYRRISPAFFLNVLLVVFAFTPDLRLWYIKVKIAYKLISLSHITNYFEISLPPKIPCGIISLLFRLTVLLWSLHYFFWAVDRRFLCSACLFSSWWVCVSESWNDFYSWICFSSNSYASVLILWCVLESGL